MKINSFIIFSLLTIIFVVLTIVIHEAGHAIGCLLVGDTIIGFGIKFPDACVTHSRGNYEWFVSSMGVIATTLLSLIAYKYKINMLLFWSACSTVGNLLTISNISDGFMLYILNLPFAMLVVAILGFLNIYFLAAMGYPLMFVISNKITKKQIYPNKNTILPLVIALVSVNVILIANIIWLLQ